MKPELKLSRKIAKSIYAKDAQRLGGIEGLRVALSMNHLKEDFSQVTQGELDARFPGPFVPDMEEVSNC